MRKADTESGAMSPLRALIIERMRQRGWEPKDVEDRGVTHATLHRYMKPLQMKTLPRPAVIKALADALELDYVVVQDAAWASIDGNRERPVGPPLQGADYVSDRDEAAIAATLSKDALLAELARRMADENTYNGDR